MQVEQTKRQEQAYTTKTIAEIRAVADFIAASYEGSEHAQPPTVTVYSFGKRAHGVRFVYDDGYKTFLKDPKYSI